MIIPVRPTATIKEKEMHIIELLKIEGGIWLLFTATEQFHPAWREMRSEGALTDRGFLLS
jgi:hypothetical protein